MSTGWQMLGLRRRPSGPTYSAMPPLREARVGSSVGLLQASRRGALIISSTRQVAKTGDADACGEASRPRNLTLLHSSIQFTRRVAGGPTGGRQGCRRAGACGGPHSTYGISSWLSRVRARLVATPASAHSQRDEAARFQTARRAESAFLLPQSRACPIPLSVETFALDTSTYGYLPLLTR